MNDRKKILITGAGGLLGRHAVAAMRDHYHVHAVVRTLPDLQIDGVDYHLLNFNSNWSTQNLPNGVDSIIHLAQSSHFREFPEMALDVFNVNVESTARLLDYAVKTKVKNFIYASSGGVYGSGNVAFDENAPVVQHQRLGYYLGSKLCSEILAQNYSSLMNIVVLRFFFMYGPTQKRSMLIPRLIDKVKAGKPISLHGEHGIRINPIHVSDSVEVLKRAIGINKSGTINIGGPEVLSIRQIGDIIGELLQTKTTYDIIPGEPKDLIGNISDMEDRLWSPRIALIDGLKSIISSI